MTRRWFSLLSLLMVTALVLPLLAGHAAAQSIDDLRASGKVGERYDGFAVARDSAVADQVAEINAKRRDIYEKEAAKQGAPLEQVGKVYAAKIVKQVPAGTWILTDKGDWLQK